jgi:hypothetical protein
MHRYFYVNLIINGCVNYDELPLWSSDQEFLAPDAEDPGSIPGANRFSTKQWVWNFKSLGTTITNQNLIQEEIKKRLNSGNAGYHSVQNRLSSHLLSKNVKVRIYKTIYLPVVLYGCETWSLTVREENKLRVFENGG